MSLVSLMQLLRNLAQPISLGMTVWQVDVICFSYTALSWRDVFI